MDINLYKVKHEFQIEDIKNHLLQNEYREKDNKRKNDVEISLFVEVSQRSATDWQIFLETNFNFEEVDLGQQVNSILVCERG
ncbi:hypothetical protein ACY2DA_00680 [Staphylococcus simulans]